MISPSADLHDVWKSNQPLGVACRHCQHRALVARERIGAWAYALTGGYSKPQLYPASFYPIMTGVDRLAEILPRVTALRALIVLRPAST